MNTGYFQTHINFAKSVAISTAFNETTYLFSLLIVDGYLDEVETLKEEVDVPESIQVHHHLQDCS
jgi:hypothetical protein